jgi:hypothetical protein
MPQKVLTNPPKGPDQALGGVNQTLESKGDVESNGDVESKDKGLSNKLGFVFVYQSVDLSLV